MRLTELKVKLSPFFPCFSAFNYISSVACFPVLKGSHPIHLLIFLCLFLLYHYAHFFSNSDFNRNQLLQQPNIFWSCAFTYSVPLFAAKQRSTYQLAGFSLSSLLYCYSEKLELTAAVNYEGYVFLISKVKNILVCQNTEEEQRLGKNRDW